MIKDRKASYSARIEKQSGEKSAMRITNVLIAVLSFFVFGLIALTANAGDGENMSRFNLSRADLLKIVEMSSPEIDEIVFWEVDSPVEQIGVIVKDLETFGVNTTQKEVKVESHDDFGKVLTCHVTDEVMMRSCPDGSLGIVTKEKVVLHLVPSNADTRHETIVVAEKRDDRDAVCVRIYNVGVEEYEKYLMSLQRIRLWMHESVK